MRARGASRSEGRGPRFASRARTARPGLLWILVYALASPVAAPAAGTNTLLAAWLDAQTNILTWSADFIQTRTLKTLVQPLTAPGHVWFAAPNRFRWELGDPPQTIAIRDTHVLYVIYPRLKRAERYPLDGAGPWRDTLALLDAGFPRSPAELESRYSVLSVTTTNNCAQVMLQPKSAAARRMIQRITIDFSPGDSELRATALQFADGSTLRNDFTNAVLNPKLDAAQFAPRLPPDYQVVEPLNER